MVLRKIEKGLIPEWHPVEAVILAWPREGMDWEYILEEVRRCYTVVIDTILKYTNVVLLVEERPSVPAQKLMEWEGTTRHRVMLIEGMTLNDTWMRDVMPLFGVRDGAKVAYDWGFNGWGLKFAANHDNMACRTLFERGDVFHPEVQGRGHRDFILEGGAIDVNSRGEMLSTACVLEEPNRNPSREPSYSDKVMSYMGVTKHHMLRRVSALLGDDTDGHIDTLARFADDDTIIYCYTADEASPNYLQTQALREDLQELRSTEGKPYTLIQLPLPAMSYDEEGTPLPATYANFLITNGAVIVPIYDDPMDEVALGIIREAMPTYEVVGVDCRALVQQHGSLHCITMQVPEGYIHPKRLER